MKDIYISELERLLKRKKTIIGMIIYFLFVCLECLFLYAVDGTSFYHENAAVQLNTLNTAPFLLRELGLYLTFILVPMLVVDSFNGEYSSGAYRFILLRPYGRVQLFFAKWIVQATIVFCLLLVTWIVGTIFGKVAFPAVTEVSFYGTESLKPLKAYAYVLLFYAIAFLIFFAQIAIGSVISVLLPNAILSYFGMIAILIGSLYVSDHFSFFISISDSTFAVLANENETLLVIVFLLISLSFIINMTVWKKRDWMR